MNNIKVTMFSNKLQLQLCNKAISSIISFCKNGFPIRHQAWWFVNKIFAKRYMQFSGPE